MAHVGQKFAFGATGGFGAVFGYPKLCRPPRHLLLEVFTMMAQFRVTFGDPAQHVVEALDEETDLLIFTVNVSYAVFCVLADFAGMLNQSHDWLRNKALQSTRQKERQG